MFVIEAEQRDGPENANAAVDDVGSPVTMIDPTTAMAEMALVSDISGVCNSRETRRITPRPMNVASMNTNNSDE